MKSADTHDQFSVALGEEAVTVLAGIAFKLLKGLRADDCQMSTDKQYDPCAPEEFRGLCSAVLKCCSTLLVRTHFKAISKSQLLPETVN